MLPACTHHHFWVCQPDVESPASTTPDAANPAVNPGAAGRHAWFRGANRSWCFYHQGVGSIPDDSPRVPPPANAESDADRLQLQRLLDAIVAVGSELSLPVVLERIIQVATDLVDASFGALGVLNEDRTGLEEFITVGIDDDTRRAIGDLPSGHGVLGLLIVEPKPLRLPDLNRHPDSFGFPPGHPPMDSFLGVPIKIRGTVFGNLYLTNKGNGEEFTDADEELTVALATAAAASIETTRLQNRLADLLIVEDRERIARDLHDTVIQRLFATGLALAGIAGRLDDPVLAQRVQSAVDDLDDTVSQIRSTIFELQRPDLTSRSVRRELLDLAEQGGRNLGFAVGTRFNGPIDTNVSGEVADQLLSVTREALSNAVRHSRATEVTVEVDADSTWVTLRVWDNGIGFDGSGSGNGLANMAARAEALGGLFAVDGASNAGCSLQWRVPVR